MSRRPLSLLLLVLALATTALVACGGDEESVDTILAQTFGEDKDIQSGRIDASFRLDAQGLANVQGPVSLRLSGPFESTGPRQLPRFDFQVAIDAAGQSLSAGAISTGEKGFLRFQDQAYAVSDELFAQFRRGYAEQAKCAEERDQGEGVSFASLGVDPRRWLREAEKAGTEEAGGVEATHITARIDVPRFLEDVNRILARTDPQPEDPCAEEQEGQPEKQPAGRQLSEQERRQIAEAVEEARVEIWTGEEDRTLRRLKVDLRFDVPEGQREQARGLTSGNVRFDLTLGGLNEEQSIEAPQDAQPLDQLLERIGVQVPGLPGAGGAQGGGAGGAEPSSAYERCVQEAAGDVVRLQECSDLIGQ